MGEAYGVLSDSKKKSRYDNGHDLEDLDGHGAHFSQGMDPNQIFESFFGGGMTSGMPGGHHFTFNNGGSPGFTFQFG